jgi:hypothetical protein
VNLALKEQLAIAFSILEDRSTMSDMGQAIVKQHLPKAEPCTLVARGMPSLKWKST